MHGRDCNVYGFVSQCFAFECLLVQWVVTLHSSIRLKRNKCQNTQLELLFLMVCVTQLRQKCGEAPLSYSRSHIVNELIEIMAHDLLRNLLSEIRNRKWFSLIADETRDESGKEQLTISLRWVDEFYNINEDLIGMFQVQKTDTQAIVNAIKDVLLRCSVPVNQCRGQAYDGASNMAGHLNGVAARLKKEEPKAHYVHCLAHSLNLCLQECGGKCSPIKDALFLTGELANLIRASPKRLALFNQLRSELAPYAPGIKPLCPGLYVLQQ